MTADPRTAAAGFTLLETLTAMTILAIAMVSLFDAHMRGLARGRRSRRLCGGAHPRRGLADRCRQRLDEQPASRSGREGRFNWSIAVAPVGAPWAQIKSKASWRLRHIRVTVAWDKDRSIVLDTLKLGRAHE